MKDRVSIDIKDHVADVRMIRTDKMNALDDPMFDALIEAGQTLAADPSIRCVVLSGEGRAFCAGIDLGRLARRADQGEAAQSEGRNLSNLLERVHGISNRAQYAAMVWRELPVPVIAAVHGVAFGGGFQIMLGADFRYIHPETKLAIMEARWGLVPDMAGTLLLRGLMREDQIRELTYTARVFSGADAFDYGIATRITDQPYDEAHQTAREIAANSPSAIEAAKRMYNAWPMSPAEALQMESDEQVLLMGSPNQRETLKAHQEKRAPVFANPRG
ncbi:MAG: crotonase/enoyl-CoA hydratase family protein [Burkholderiaceae bacterium]